jgi:hypothetical protein
VVALTDCARAACADAERARQQSVSLRLAIRRQVREHARRRATHRSSIDRLLHLQSRTYRTPWSDLPWRLRISLDDVLELVEG